MADEKPRVYWESSPFVAFIAGEGGRAHICRELLNQARNGTIDLYTSSLTLVEVYKVPGTPAEEEAESKLTEFFRNRWIKKQDVDWWVAAEARKVQRSFPHLDGRDAIHLATAIYLGVDYLHTYDEDDLIRCDGHVPSLKICEPSPFGTIPMDLGGTAQTPSL